MKAYATWAGKVLQTEPEWEFCGARRVCDAEYGWGDVFTPGGQHMANIWQGRFPNGNLNQDGYDRTSPVTAFPPNGYGLHDMIGNIWKWTSDWYTTRRVADTQSLDPAQSDIKIPRKALRDSSHL